MGLLNPPKNLDELEDESDRTATQLSIEQKRALIREAKKRYGSDWKLHLPKIVSGFDWKALRFKL